MQETIPQAIRRVQDEIVTAGRRIRTAHQVWLDEIEFKNGLCRELSELVGRQEVLDITGQANERDDQP